MVLLQNILFLVVCNPIENKIKVLRRGLQCKCQGLLIINNLFQLTIPQRGPLLFVIIFLKKKVLKLLHVFLKKVTFTRFKNKTNHIIIEIEMELIEKKLFTKNILINGALERINKDETLIRSIINWNYYIFTYFFSYMSILFCKKYSVSKIYFVEKNQEEIVLYEKRTIFLYDKGFFIDSFLIPYEYIVSFSDHGGICEHDIFATIDKNDFKIILGDGLLKLIVEMDYPRDFCKDIKINMYYHIKYNKINEEVFDHYFKTIFKNN